MDVIDTRYFTFAHPPDELELDSGGRLGPITVAYETYGTLNAQRSNAILILHALSGDAHAAGSHAGEGRPGWWDSMIGPGKGFDTDRYFVICSNVLGGCKGTTGPSSMDPATGQPHGLGFPVITIGDMVRVQARLLDHLGIETLLSVAGGSMGGMQALEWLVSYPDRLHSAILIATAAKHSPQQIAFNEVGRQAILADPNWKDGHYYGGPPPAKGLSVARMVGHITYMSDLSMAEKFGRRIREGRRRARFGNGFEVEEYLRDRGDNFVRRFDANSYLYITKAMDSFDVSAGQDLAERFRRVLAKVLVLSFRSDWLYPSSQSLELVRAFKRASVDATYCEIDSTYGHDAFLLEAETETRLVRHFLETVTRERTPAEAKGLVAVRSRTRSG